LEGFETLGYGFPLDLAAEAEVEALALALAVDLDEGPARDAEEADDFLPLSFFDCCVHAGRSKDRVRINVHGGRETGEPVCCSCTRGPRVSNFISSSAWNMSLEDIDLC
jgi:hypothetical protein